MITAFLDPGQLTTSLMPYWLINDTNACTSLLLEYILLAVNSFFLEVLSSTLLFLNILFFLLLFFKEAQNGAEFSFGFCPFNILVAIA